MYVQYRKLHVVQRQSGVNRQASVGVPPRRGDQQAQIESRTDRIVRAYLRSASRQR